MESGVIFEELQVEGVGGLGVRPHTPILLQKTGLLPNLIKILIVVQIKKALERGGFPDFHFYNLIVCLLDIVGFVA